MAKRRKGSASATAVSALAAKPLPCLATSAAARTAAFMAASFYQPLQSIREQIAVQTLAEGANRCTEGSAFLIEAKAYNTTCVLLE